MSYRKWWAYRVDIQFLNPEDVNTFIIDYLALPALHLLIGPFNSLYKILEELAPEVNKVAEKLGAVKEDYFGKTFEGNETESMSTFLWTAWILFIKLKNHVLNTL